jgi:hypothetical protein
MPPGGGMPPGMGGPGGLPPGMGGQGGMPGGGANPLSNLFKKRK